MCGRFTLHTPVQQWVTTLLPGFDEEVAAAGRPRYNIAPTQDVWCVRESGSGSAARTRELRTMRWGLLPVWAKELSLGVKMINARSETAHEKPSFRQALAKRRCLIPADGYYEWQREGKAKQAFHIHAADSQTLWFAGLWETNPQLSSTDEPLLSCTILTMAASADVAHVHDRMPVLVPQEFQSVWLSEEPHGRQVLDGLLATPHSGTLAADPVSAYVNNARHEGPECLSS